ncbi:MAG: metallophosphoesterase [Candidatus Altiarchaeales archaeon ex4484_43]|nr:MAG: metallophosphoesterase [Candidatus Altiarchaeales archaeon ex4484_43]
MKILCIADIHGDRESLLRLKRYAIDSKFENILILGDFSNYDTFRNREKSLEEVRFVLDLLSNFRVLAIPGNCDTPETLNLFDEYGVNLHENSVVFNNSTIIGFGGSAPTPFDTPFEMEEKEIYEKLEKLLNGVKTERVVLVVHNPPLDTECDITRLGVHVGSKAVRDIVEKFQPEILLSSHIHESGGSTDTIGKTKVVNVGPLTHEMFGILHLNKDIDIELSEL